MKRKYLAFLMVAAMGLSLMACEKAPSQTTENKGKTEVTESGKSSADTSEAGEEASDEKSSEAESTENEKNSSNTPFLKITENYYNAGEDSRYFMGSYNTAELVGEEYPELKTAVDTWFADAKSNFESQAETSIQDAKVDADFRGEDFSAYSLDNKVKATRLDNRAVSMEISTTSYNGGAHGSTYISGLTFDTKTGEELTFDDLGDIRADVKSYVTEYIEQKRTEDYTFDLFEDAIEGKLDSPDWYLSGAGLVFIFNEYEIGSYAEGRVFVTIPYEKMKNFNSDYLLENDAMFVGLMENAPVDIDTDKDGTAEKVELHTEYNDNYEMAISLKINDLSLDIGTASVFKNAYFVRTDNGKNYILMTYDVMSDDYVTELIDVTEQTPKKADKIEGGSLIGMSNSIIGASVKIDTLGSYMGYRTYRFDSGKFEPVEERFDFGKERNHFGYPTTKAAVKVMLTEDGKLVEKELPAGTTIYPVNSDGESVVGFELEDGTYGEITIEMKDGMKYIDGVEEYEVFDNLPYAG